MDDLNRTEREGVPTVPGAQIVEPPPPVSKPPRKVRQKPKKPKDRRKTGWLRQLTAWLGLFLILGCGAFGLSDFKVASWQIQIPAFWQPSSRSERLVVLIDPGHGGHDSGARAGGIVEKDLNLEVGRKVKDELERRGIRAELTRDSDRFLALSERSGLANRLPNCVFVSVHFNHAKESGATGVETYYSSEKVINRLDRGLLHAVVDLFSPAPPLHEDDSRVLAESIQAALVEMTGATDRGVKDHRLFVVRHTPHAAALVEGGFISNQEESKKLGDVEYRDKLARAVAEGIVDYLSVTQRLQAAR